MVVDVVFCRIGSLFFLRIVFEFVDVVFGRITGSCRSLLLSQVSIFETLEHWRPKTYFDFRGRRWRRGGHGEQCRKDGDDRGLEMHVGLLVLLFEVVNLRPSVELQKTR